MSRVDGFPFELSAQGDAPVSVDAGTLRIEAGARTDLFVSPDGAPPSSTRRICSRRCRATSC